MRRYLLIAGWGQCSSSLDSLGLELEKEGEVFKTSVAELCPSYAESLTVEVAKSDLPTVIVGWSMGGIVCLEAIIAKGLEVSGLVLLGSIASFCSSDSYPYGMERSEARALGPAFKKDRLEFLRGFFQMLHAPTGVEEEWLEQKIKLAGSIGEEKLLDGLRYLEQSDFSESLNTISVPTLLCHGEEDIVIPKEASQFLKTKIPRSELSLLPQAGHNLVETHAGEIALRIKEVFSDV